MKRYIKLVIALACGILASCAIITVNVYFPEKDVKEAYKSLDDMLLKQDKTAPVEAAPPGEQAPEAKPASPISSLSLPTLSFSLASVANAQEGVADELAVEMSGMDDVLQAYDEMKARLPKLDELRNKGIVGESNDGRLVLRDAGKAGEAQPIIDGENRNRRTVIVGMAKAILKINKQPESKAAMGQVLGQAAKTFADTKREAAKAGWWVQLPGKDGRWVQK
jgi:uncharacterized protein YdbL (DUF1318 family)